MNSNRLIGNLAMLTTAMLFGGNFTLTKYVLDEQCVTPTSLMMMRVVFSFLVFGGISLFTKRESIEKKDFLWIILAALLGIVGNQCLFILGISLTSPIDGSIIATLAPIITIIVSYFYLQEAISKKKVTGVILGASGALLLIFFTHKGYSGEGSSLQGNVAFLGSASSYACFLVFGKGISKKYKPVTLMKWMFLVSCIVLTPFYLKPFIDAPIWHMPFNWKHTGAAAYIVIGATCLPYFLLPIAQRTISATATGMYSYVIPVVATALSIWMGQGELTFPKILCALLVFGGVFLVSQSNKTK